MSLTDEDLRQLEIQAETRACPTVTYDHREKIKRRIFARLILERALDEIIEAPFGHENSIVVDTWHAAQNHHVALIRALIPEQAGDSNAAD